jgi:hypothetical protein
MLQSRRGFLIGAGALLTAFVKDARSFIHRTVFSASRAAMARKANATRKRNKQISP